MPILNNSQHEAFVQELFKGSSPTEAHRVAAGNKTGNRVVGPRWAKLPEVAKRLLELQKEAARGNVLEMRERREFLARVVRADLDKLDLDKDGDLIQEKIITTTDNGTTIKVKLPGKRECVMSDAELSGELIGRIDHTTDGQPISAPVINFIVPPVFAQRRGIEHAPN